MMVNECNGNAATRDRTGDLQIFSLTLSQLSYSGSNELYEQNTRMIRKLFCVTYRISHTGVEPVSAG